MHLLTTQQNERKPSASEPQFAVTHENGPEEEAHVLGGMRVRRPMVGVGGCSRVVSPLEVLLFPPDSQCSALSAGRLAVTSPLRWASLCACLLLSRAFCPPNTRRHAPALHAGGPLTQWATRISRTAETGLPVQVDL